MMRLFGYLLDHPSLFRMMLRRIMAEIVRQAVGAEGGLPETTWTEKRARQRAFQSQPVGQHLTNVAPGNGRSSKNAAKTERPLL